MQSQLFRTFCSPFSPAFPHGRFVAEPLRGRRGVPVLLGWCRSSDLQPSMGALPVALTHSPLFPALQLFRRGLPRSGALPVHLHHQASTSVVSCCLLGASPQQLWVRCEDGENLAATRSHATSAVFSDELNGA